MNVLQKLAARGRDFLIGPLLRKPTEAWRPDAASQLQLKLTYQALKASGNALPRLDECGFKVYSQDDEDGILLYIFALVGTTNRTCAEICAGDGVECNSANLILNHGWHGLLVDGNAALVRAGTEFYRRNPRTYVHPPAFAHAWITRDSVNTVLQNNGFAGEIDLLSLDLDGVDYWIWDAITCITPRVVVVEYQDILGPDRALTVPYSDTFHAGDHPTTHGMPNYCGASLPAFVKLARTKGYRLVGCSRRCCNAFFIRNPLGETEIPEVDAHTCFRHPKAQWGMRERYPTVKDFPWVEV